MVNNKLYIDDQQAYDEYKEYIMSISPDDITIEGNIVKTNDYTVEVNDDYKSIISYIKSLNSPSIYSNELIYGKDVTEEIVAIEVVGNDLVLFFNNGDTETRACKFWMCANRKLDSKFSKMKGNSHYKYIRVFNDKSQFDKYRNIYRRKDTFNVWNDVESQMISNGLTLFKGLKVEDVSALSFDIEGSGLVRDKTSQVFVITNTLKKDGKTSVTQFREDNYNNQGDMIEAWCNWVREVDPTIINGHNVFGYDLDYMNHVAKLHGKKLLLGKDGSSAIFGKKAKNYRVDGSQTWEYYNCTIFGRHVIDGMFLAVKYDIGRNYPSWGLKAIAEYEGLVDDDRQFYDASKIGQNWSDPVEREKIVKYCEDDGNDSMALYELMIPSFFYMAQSIPKPLQVIVNSASGSWLNTIMLRSYIQELHSIPKTDKQKYVGGGMSYGIPGVYDNVTKWDAKSYYPNTILKFKIYDKKKDPKANYLKMVEHFTNKRFEQKTEYKKTGDKYYDDLQAASKVFINSAYGLLGTNGLNFNCFEKAALITRCCRKGLQKCILWATGHDYLHWWNPNDNLYKEVVIPSKDLKVTLEKYENRCEILSENDNETHTLYVPRRKTKDKWKVSYIHSDTGRDDFDDYDVIDKYSQWSVDEMPRHDWRLVNIDTDSLSFAKKDSSPYTAEEHQIIHEEINKIMYSEWEDDGSFDRVVVSKAKNYVLKNGDNIKYKGSSLTDTKKEPALLEMLDRILKECFIYETNTPDMIYKDYVKEVLNIKDINRWATKKSITQKLFESDRANETKVVDAIKGKDFQIGDKIFLYSTVDGEVPEMKKGVPVVYKKTGLTKMIPNKILRLSEEYDGKYNVDHYLKRVRDTVEILGNIVDMDTIPNYNNVAGKKLLLEDFND